MKQILGVMCLLVLAGCTTSYPKDVLKVSEASLSKRTTQTRSYSGVKEETVLSASSMVLQDLGFAIEGGESRLGLVSGSKDRDATEGGQVAWATASVLLAALSGTSSDAYQQMDKDQKIRASVVTSKALNGDGTLVRVTFQRIVRNGYERITKLETLDDPELYLGFHEKLSKAVFLEDQQI